MIRRILDKIFKPVPMECNCIWYNDIMDECEVYVESGEECKRMRKRRDEV